jgi:aminoglycoside phosphotransferase (APT) family kinase protein
VQQWLPGHSPELLPASSQPAGAVLADLHADAHVRRPAITADDILAKCSARVDLVGRLLPALRLELDALLADLDRLEPHNRGVVTSHGNYHAGQLLAGPTGLVVLDVDRLCLAAPAYDLASYAAHVAFGRPGDAQVMAATLETLVEAYGTRPPGLDWYLATCLLRRAAVPFRFQDEHWPQAVTELVRLAREALR